MSSPEVLQLGSCEVDLARHEVRRPQVVPLTPLEVSLLRYLAARPGQAVSKEDLLEHVWGWKRTLQTRAVFHAVTRLRKKVEPDPDAPRFLVAVFGVGYRLELPAPATPSGPPFREREWSAMCAAFDEGAPLVTLVGPRGAGRATLARHWVAQDGRGVVVAGGEDWPAHLLAALGVGEVASPLDALPSALPHRRAALVDLAPEAAPSLSALVGVPGVTLVATSGAPLGVPGERVVPVGPLALPDGDAALAREVPSVALFLRVARRARPDLELRDEDAPAVHSVVRGTGGHALSLTLAAGRLAVLGIDDLRSLAEDAAAPGDELDRALSQWWAAVPEGDRAALCALAAFRDGAPVAGVVAAAGTLEVVRRLERLVGTGIVAASEPPDPPKDARFALPPPVRHFVLRRAGPEPVDRATAWLASLADEAAFEARCGPDGTVHRNRLRREAGQLAAAALDAARTGHPSRVGLTIAAHHATSAGGPWAPSLAAAERVLADVDDAGLRVAVAQGRSWTGRPDSEHLLAGVLEDPTWGPVARDHLGVAHFNAGRLADAERELRRALTDLAARPGRALYARQHLSWVYRLQGRFDEARALTLQSVAQIDDPGHWLWPSLEVDLAAVELAANRGADVVGRLTAAARDLQRMGAGRRSIQAQQLRGVAALGARRWDEAERAFTEALGLERAHGDRRAVAGTFVNLGIVRARRERFDEATEAFERAAAGYAALGDRRGEGFARLNHAISLRKTDPAAARRHLDDAVAAGRATGVPRLLGPALAERALLEPDPEAAERLSAEAIGLSPRLEPGLEAVVRCARAATHPPTREEHRARFEELRARLAPEDAKELAERWSEATGGRARSG